MVLYFYLCKWGCFFGALASHSSGNDYPFAEREILYYQEVQMRVKITLACEECKQRNYDTKKNKKNDPDRLEIKKYCRFCRKHTLHKETK